MGCQVTTEEVVDFDLPLILYLHKVKEALHLIHDKRRSVLFILFTFFLLLEKVFDFIDSFLKFEFLLLLGLVKDFSQLLGQHIFLIIAKVCCNAF